MASDPISSLAQALRQASQPVTLSAELIAGAGATPPPGFDGQLEAAFRLPRGAGLSVWFDSSDVGPVQGGWFRVSNASLEFLGYDRSKSEVTLRFAEAADHVEVVIEVVLTGWTFPVTFPQMSGWPFCLLDLKTPTFAFASDSTEWTWTGGGSVTLQPQQNFIATATVPEAFGPIAKFATDLGALPSSVTLAGRAKVDRALVAGDDEDEASTILYPDLDLWGSFGTQPVNVFFLTASDPGFGLLVEPAEEDTQPQEPDVHEPDVGEGAIDAEPEVRFVQTPSLYLGLTMEVGGVELALRSRLMNSGRRFAFSLTVDEDSPVTLTPAAAVELLAGGSGQSFLGSIPGPLQQFLSSLAVEGLGLSGTLQPSPALGSASMSISTASGARIPLFSDPVNGQKFAIDGFSVNWAIVDPLGKRPHNLVTIHAAFELWKPAVFDGVFHVSIDQDMRIDGSFDGKVELDSLLRTVTGGAIGLPNGVDVSFSDAAIHIDPTARSYAFACVANVEVDLLEPAGKPLLQIHDMRLALAALTPPSGSGKTAYRAGIAGFLAIGPLAANVEMAYDGLQTPAVWTLHAALAEQFELSKLINQFFEAYDLPSFLPGELELSAFSIDASIPSGSATELAAPGAPQSSYKIATALSWKALPFGTALTAKLGLRYDGAAASGQQYTGSAIAEVSIAEGALPFKLQVGYRFGAAARDALERVPPAPPAPTEIGASQVLWVEWEGIRGEYDFSADTVTVSLADWSLGSLIQALMRTLGNPYFTLDSPWDVLNEISLSGLRLTIYVGSDPKRPRFTAFYTLSRPIDLVFVKVNGIRLARSPEGKVMLALEASVTIPGLESAPLFNPATSGQDVTKMPQVPNQGGAWFKLRLLALGQRIAIYGAPDFESTADAIKWLSKAPGSQAGSNPVDPSSTTRGQPRYDPDAGWLAALDFGLLQVEGQYTLECMVVFDDPGLYGLRLAFNGTKAKVLEGLSIDVLYKKVSDDVGVYQVELSFPKALRQLDFGAFTVTLPTIGVQIYTNGDFLFDFGFPYNLDFSRSFTLQAIIYGVPVLGSAGFYFGRLPAAATPQLPQRYVGSFSPAIVFGFGAQLGVGRYFQKGPLSAGFSITVFGIVEGVLAAWTPPAVVSPQRGTPVQGDYYFWLQGTFGVIGRLYGSVDFAIVKADVQLTVQLVAQIVFEAFADIELSASAHVSVSVSVKIDLGPFSIGIHFSFAATVTAQIAIETHGTPPWLPQGAAPPQRRRRDLTAARTGRPLQAPPAPAFKAAVRSSSPAAAIALTPAPQFTVCGSEAGPLSAQEGAFVFLLAIDAPAADGAGNREGSSFQSLCEGLLSWVIDAYVNPSGTTVDLDTFPAHTAVSKAQLDEIAGLLAAPGGSPIEEAEVESKLLGAELADATPGFTVNLAPATCADRGRLQAGATSFPAFSGLSLSFPDPGGGQGQQTIALSDYVTIDAGYRQQLTALFQKLAAQVEEERGGAPAAAVVGDDGGEPMSRFLFEDWFTIVAGQLLHAASVALDDYHYVLRGGESIGSFVRWANDAGNQLDALDVAAPNLTHPLNAGKPLLIGGLSYTVQRDDTLARVAAAYSDSAASPRWTTAPSALILENAAVHGLLAAGATIAVGAASYVARAGDSFQDAATALKVTVEALSKQPVLYTQAGLLAPAAQIAIPAIAYTTGQDTLQTVIARFGVPLATLLGEAANQDVRDLFADGTIAIAGLDRLHVADLWQALLAADEVAQVAGMVGRFSLHGMRLPAMSGLTLPSKGFVYPTDESEYGLYQLTGQQFPTPPLTPTSEYGLTVAKDGTLSWLELAGSKTSASFPLDLCAQARGLYYVLQYARQHGYDPQPTLVAEPDALVGPKRYALPAPTPLSSSDQARLAVVTRPPGVVADQTPAPQAGPLLWGLPSSLLRRVEELQAALEARWERTADLLQYLPVLQPQLATSNPASGHTSFAVLADYALATRVQVKVEKLAQTDDLAPQRPDANSVVPPGPGNTGAPAPLAPYNYALVGTTPGDALLLQRLLTAMDSLGQELVSGLFLCHAPSAGTTGLSCRGDSEFLSFITQTNLSTETKPPSIAREQAEALGPPRGIANSPAELVKLLWELSTVNDGGYYLFYQLPQEGAGLPDALFDSSGAATLTLVIAYDRAMLGPADAGRLTSFVNALLTTEPIDLARSTLTLASQPAAAAAAPLTGVETLADLTALYGTDPGLLAELNDTAPITTGSRIGIAGVVHQVSELDLAGGDPLGAVAKRYSASAAQPLTAADLAAFNPGVMPALGAALRVPPFTYLAGAAAGPGTSFASLSEYYGLSYDALGFAAQLVPGLFPASATPAVTAAQRDLIGGLGVGNAGVSLTRANLGEPPEDPTDPSYGPAYLFSLYTLLQSSLLEGPFFDSSPPGMPFGPRSLLLGDQALALRSPQRRRALLAAEAGRSLEYSQAVGFGSFATLNAAPDPAGEELPPRSANPYVGVGSVLQLGLRWLDLFGNVTPTPFSAPPPGYSGPLGNLPVSIDYADRLIGLGQWPNVQTYYSYASAGDGPQLNVTFKLQAAAYAQPPDADDPLARPAATGDPVWQQNAINDLRTFTRIYFQLNQDYDGLGVPGLAGQAVRMAFEHTLLADPQLPLSAEQSEQLRDFISACLTYVWNRAQGHDGGTPPQALINVPIDLTALASADAIPLRLAFTLARQPGLTDSALRAVGGGSDTTPIMPFLGDSATSVSLSEFATGAEAALVTADWQLRIGASATTPGATDAVSVWAVRMAKTPGAGLGYEIGSRPNFFAPRPPAKMLRAAAPTVGRYSTGKAFPDGAQQLSFTGADLNAWTQIALQAIDSFLSAAYAAPAFVLDQLVVPDDPEQNGYLAKILEHKRALAAAIARTVEPILAGGNDDQATRDAAADKLRQALLDELRMAFTLTAVVVFEVTEAKWRESLAPGVVSPPRFYGQPVGALVRDAGGQRRFSLSSAKVPLTRVDADGQTRLAFLFGAQDVTEESYVTLDLSYAMAQLEHDIRNVPGIKDYEQSQWIKFVSGPFTTAIATRVQVPLVLRALPQPPTVMTQTAVAATAAGATGPSEIAPGAVPAELASWDYAFSYLYPAAAQDAVGVTVQLNTPPETLADPSPDDELFAALAQFTTAYPAIQADLDACLRPIDGNTKPEDPKVQDAHCAVAALAAIAGELASAYDRWSKPTPPRRQPLGEDLPPIVHAFEVGLSADVQNGGRARVDVYADASVPQPAVLIDPDTYTAKAATPAPRARWGYEYLRKGRSGDDPADWLGYEQALEVPARTIAYDDLDVFGAQNAWAAVKVVRNERLLPSDQVGDATTETFLFKTPEVKFANPVVPMLSYPSFDLGSVQPGPATLESYLDAFFLSLLTAASGQPIAVKLAAAYSYLLAPSLPPTVLPIALLPPTSTTPQRNQPPTFVQPFAAAIDAWLATHKPAANGDSRLIFALDVFAGKDPQQTLPLLTIRELHLATSALGPA